MKRASESLKPARAFALPLVLAGALVACAHAKHVNEGDPEGSASSKTSKADKKGDEKKSDEKKDVAAKDEGKKSDDKKDDGKKEEHAAVEPKPATGTASHDEPPTDGQGGSGLRRPSRRPTGTTSHDEPPSDNVPGQNKTGLILADTPSGLHKPGGDQKIATALKNHGFLKTDKDVSPDDLTAAVRKFQHSKDTEETGYADEQTLRLLGLDPRDIVRKP